MMSTRVEEGGNGSDCDTVPKLIADLDDAEATSRIGSLAQEIETVLKNYQDLENNYKKAMEDSQRIEPTEVQNVDSLTVDSVKSESILIAKTKENKELDPYAVPYLAHLTVYVDQFRESVEEVKNNRVVMNEATKDLVDYFGEDIGSCEMSKVFIVLSEFRRAVIVSRDTHVKNVRLIKRENSFKK
jgi:hypothetical protein